MACLALERATGERYAQFLSSALWKPMGAGDAWVWLDRSNAHARCYASLLARPLDWLKIGILLKDHGKLQGRQLVAGSWIDQMLAPSPTNPAYGMQVWRGSAFASKRFYNGDSTGFAIASAAPFPWPDVTYLDGFGGQRVYISRCADVVIVRLGRFVADWDDTSLPIQVGKLLERKNKNRCRKT